MSELRKNRDFNGKGQDIFMPKNVDLVNQYLVNMETYTMKDIKRVIPSLFIGEFVVEGEGVSAQPHVV